MIGETVGSYRIVKPLSHGGMGEVFIAEHALLGRRAAIKLLLPDVSRDAEAVKRFFNEARATANLHHAGLVEVFDFGHHSSGRAFLVMELLEGESLAARLDRGALPQELAALIARQIARAVGAAHAHGIVHRDLKPDNLFLVPDAESPGGLRVKVLDFGIAKLADASLTSSNVIMGTAAYMAPEQCRSAADVDQRADVYSLGCILFEMSSGRPPFLGSALTQLIAAHLHEAPPPLRSLVPLLHPDFEQLVGRMLEKDLLQRPQTMDEVAAWLDRIGGAGTAPSNRVAAFAATESGATPVARHASAPMAAAPYRPSASAPMAPYGPSASAPMAAAVSPPSASGQPVPAGTIPAAPIPVGTLPATAAQRLARNRNALLAAGAAVAGVIIYFCIPHKVHLHINSNPPGAAVVNKLDGKTICYTPCDREVDKGNGQLAVGLELGGYDKGNAVLSFATDQTAEVVLNKPPPLTYRKPPSPAPPKPPVVIYVAPPAPHFPGLHLPFPIPGFGSGRRR